METQADIFSLIKRKFNRTNLLIGFVLLLIAGVLIITRPASFNGKSGLVAETSGEYEVADIKEIVEEGETEIYGQSYKYQELKVEFTTGSDKGNTLQIRNDIQPGAESAQTLKAGDTVVITKVEDEFGSDYYISDRYRVPAVLIIFVIFFALTVIFAGTRGLTSILGLGFTILVLISYVVPKIVAGEDPMLVSISGAFIIAVVSIYLAHGFNKRTSIALGGTLITIAIATLLSVIFVSLAMLAGTGSEEALFLNISSVGQINLRGLLLGGMIFGVLGVLDDVTTAQSAAVEELKRANPKLDTRELYKRGISIGKEHIVSLVNTLVLAYLGSSFPLLLLFSMNQAVPLWVTLNSEYIIEELIRTLVGSTALIFAVPITTLMAAYYFNRWEVSATKNKISHSHAH